MELKTENLEPLSGKGQGVCSYQNFVGRNGHMLRKAFYENQWIRRTDGKWVELTTAKFSHDRTGREDRLDRFMGLEQGTFFLSHGGFVPGHTKFGTPFTRPPSGHPPAMMDLTLWKEVANHE